MKNIVITLIFFSPLAFTSQENPRCWDRISYYKTLRTEIGSLRLDVYLKPEFSNTTKTVKNLVFVLNNTPIEIPKDVIDNFKGIDPGSFTLSTSYYSDATGTPDTVITAAFNYGFPSCVREGRISVRSTGYLLHMITEDDNCSSEP
ncbi:hypothetical protein ACJJIR_02315 [Microbulbifer sp. SSSA008]|uniref:hypothetical protein n=1 Tax=Microbulbifer sp. SSSA008 TaxID=3243380 RepID=UPI004039FB57